MKFTATITTTGILLFPLLAFTNPAPEDTNSDDLTNLASSAESSQQVLLKRKISWLIPKPAIWYEGDRQETACNTNGHTCDGKTLTNEVCAQQCYCDIDSGMISCSPWNKCRGETVEWNCQCHSKDVPPKGSCGGFYDTMQGITAEMDGKWPAIAPNKVDAHPAKVFAEYQ